MDNARQWAFVADMNYDGAVTISDVWLWAQWAFYYPGDLLLAGLMKGLPYVARFLEITPASYGGFFSFIVGLVFWFIAGFMILVAVGSMWEAVRRPAESAQDMRKSRGYDK